MAQTLTDGDIADLKERFRRFINEAVIPAEPVLVQEDDAAAKKLRELKELAKQRGLWALGHPEEIGGGGLPFMVFAHMNEVIGRSHWGQLAVGSISSQDSSMLHLYGTPEQKSRGLGPLVACDT